MFKFFSNYNKLIIFFSTLMLLINLYLKTQFNFTILINKYLFYTIIFSILILLNILMIVLSKKFTIYLIIFFYSFIFSIYLFQSFLIINDKLQLKKIIELNEKIYFKKEGKKYDKRSKKDLYLELNKDKNISVMYAGLVYLFDKPIRTLSGISNSLTIKCNENGYYTYFTSDRYGFNNQDSIWDVSKIDYLLLGDSFVMGECVNSPNEISGILKNLTKKNILNLGYSDTGQLTQYAILREYIKVDVDNIFLFFFEGSDLNDLYHEMNDTILKKYLLDRNYTQNIKIHQKKIDLLKKDILEKLFLKEYFFLSKFIKLTYLNSYFSKTLILSNHMTDEKIYDHFENVLNEIKILTEEKNSTLHFVYLPSIHRFHYDNFDTKMLDKIKKIVGNQNIPFIDMIDLVFNKENDPLKLFPFNYSGREFPKFYLSSPPGFHYNVLGYKKISEALNNYINQNLK